MLNPEQRGPTPPRHVAPPDLDLAQLSPGPCTGPGNLGTDHPTGASSYPARGCLGLFGVISGPPQRLVSIAFARGCPHQETDSAIPPAAWGVFGSGHPPGCAAGSPHPGIRPLAPAPAPGGSSSQVEGLGVGELPPGIQARAHLRATSPAVSHNYPSRQLAPTMRLKIDGRRG